MFRPFSSASGGGWLPHAEETVRIEIRHGSVLIDVTDEEWVRSLPWRVVSNRCGNFYAVTGRRAKAMHSLLLEPPSGLEVDHVNGDGLDNRRSNLRLATRAQNQANRKPQPGTSIYKGVCWDPKKRCWVAQISVEGRNRRIGRFKDEIDAAHAYDRIALELRGEFARINFPEAVSC